jgi:hypothetical protein
MMMAELHLTGELTGSKLTDSEVDVRIPFYQDQTRRANQGTPLGTYERRVDLITTRPDGKQTWWELKSLLDGSEQGLDFATW